MAQELVEKKLQLKVEDLTLQGLGFCRLENGKACYLLGGWPGDIALFEIIEDKKRFCKAQLIEIIEPSADRVSPPCPHFGFKKGQCSSCLWSFASYNSQIQFKKKMLTQMFQRSGHEFPKIEFQEAPEPWGYRNRTQLKTNGQEIGYISRGSKSLAPIENCLLLNPPLQEYVTELQKQLPNPEWKPKSKYKYNLIELDDRTPLDEVKINRRENFRQGNSQQNQFMQNWLESKTTGWSGEVLELFAGSGNFTQSLLKNSRLNITASEMAGPALEELRRQLPQVQAIACNHYESKNWQLFAATKKNFDFLVLDPPREGFPLLKEFLHKFPSIKEVIYISCDIHYLSRDLVALDSHGFSVASVQGVDQFPQTPHIETLVHLKKTPAGL